MARRIGWLLLLGAAVGLQAPSVHAQPNLVAIVTDDQAQWAMGAYGNDDIQTPNMDRIGEAGALFRNAFVVTPVCSPSRATYLTGLYPTEVGITDWIAPVEADAGLGLRGRTWPQALQQEGYRTGLFGKWHLGTKPEYHPTRLGFDEFAGFLAGGTRPMDAPLEIGGEARKTEGPLPDVLTDLALDFVRRHRQQPFCVCLHFRAPHLPYTPVPEVDAAVHRDADVSVPTHRALDTDLLVRRHRDYYNSIHSVDRNIGRLLDELARLGLADETIVLFTSDHGYNEGRHLINTKGNGHWMAGGVNGPKRPNMWDTSLRIPLVVQWPGKIAPGTVIEETVSNLDMYRTMLGLLDIEVPQDAAARGRDVSPLLFGGSIDAEPFLFGQYDLHNNGLAYLRMVRGDRYKFVRHFKTNFMDELYDLEVDPGETRNLFRRADLQPVVEELRGELTRWQESIDDPILQSNY